MSLNTPKSSTLLTSTKSPKSPKSFGSPKKHGSPPKNLHIPPILVTTRKAIPIREWFLNDLTALNLRFIPLAGTQSPGDIRITIWTSDGRVIYDNYNGTNTTDLSNNYYTSGIQQNNHVARLETLLATKHGDGVAQRTSSTVAGQNFRYWCQWVYNPITNEYRGARIALQIP
jgi:hypothetical protein